MMKVTKISHEGISLIKEYEGFRSKPYLCPAGVPTIGYGSTYYKDGTKVKLTDPSINENDATDLLMSTLLRYENAVDKLCTDNLTQNQFDALVSFTYNLGENNLRSSTLLKKVNADSNDPSISTEFSKWVYADGKVLEGLVKRRRAEAKLYFDDNA